MTLCRWLGHNWHLLKPDLRECRRCGLRQDSIRIVLPAQAYWDKHHLIHFEIVGVNRDIWVDAPPQGVIVDGQL